MKRTRDIEEIIEWSKQFYTLDGDVPVFTIPQSKNIERLFNSLPKLVHYRTCHPTGSYKTMLTSQEFPMISVDTLTCYYTIFDAHENNQLYAYEFTGKDMINFDVERMHIFCYGASLWHVRHVTDGEFIHMIETDFYRLRRLHNTHDKI